MHLQFCVEGENKTAKLPIGPNVQSVFVDKEELAIEMKRLNNTITEERKDVDKSMHRQVKESDVMLLYKLKNTVCKDIATEMIRTQKFTEKYIWN